MAVSLTEKDGYLGHFLRTHSNLDWMMTGIHHVHRWSSRVNRLNTDLEEACVMAMSFSSRRPLLANTINYVVVVSSRDRHVFVLRGLTLILGRPTRSDDPIILLVHIIES